MPLWVQPCTILDVMPLDEKILGFTNRWYRAALQTAVTRRLSGDLEIRMIAPPFFIATKLEAFNGRGKGDIFSSPDLEDIITVVDGRTTIVAEIQAQTADLRTYVRTEINALLAAGLIDALPGYLLPDEMSQARITTVLRRIDELVAPF